MKVRLSGSPPRVRSRQSGSVATRSPGGITSACAEQTLSVRRRRSGVRDHLRVCGADKPARPSNKIVQGSPPRVRSRLAQCAGHADRRGITSACAEQTTGFVGRVVPDEDHLRVCGADSQPASTSYETAGSPPRVRSRLGDDLHALVQGGITSACAEQTMVSHANHGSARDHLRVCGADASRTNPASSRSGSPPRVRSRRAAYLVADDAAGITSACAEQTLTTRIPSCIRRDHLRVCGADRLGLSFHRVHPGSPPRVRSRRSPTCRGPCQTGITSACAEQTVRGRPSVRRRRDHLRVCGADAAPPLMPLSFLGLPPRVRSRHLGIELPVFIPGITSACAEQTDSCYLSCTR